MAIRRLTLVSVLWLATFACRGPAEWQYEKSVEESSPSSAHAVHQERLQQRMNELDRLRSERLPKAFDMQVEEDRRARGVARVAQALADSASEIPAAAPERLDERERAAFLALAGELGERTQRLADEAVHLTPEQRDAQLDEIDATCAGCHRRFRISRVRDDRP